MSGNQHQREEHTLAFPDGVRIRFVVDNNLPDGVLMVATNQRREVVGLVTGWEAESTLRDLLDPHPPSRQCGCPMCAPSFQPEQDTPRGDDEYDPGSAPRPLLEVETPAAEAARLRPGHVTDTVVDQALAGLASAPAAERAPVVHELKITREHFSAVLVGAKRAEYRRLDRDFKVGDTLALHEIGLPVGPGVEYTGRSCRVRVTHIATAAPLPDGFGLLSFGHPGEFDHPKHWREILAEHEKALEEVIEQRDAREVLVDHLLDLVLGADRPEWSSAYGYSDATREAEEAVGNMRQVAQEREQHLRIVDAAHKWGDAQPDSSAACSNLLEALGRRRRRSTDGAGT